MFKKLVSGLQFNPGLINQISFYGKRLHREESMRRLGFIFISATMLVNLFAVIVPAKNTFAGSDSNIMVGGGSGTKEGILQKYDADPWVQAVYARDEFQISRADIEKMTPGTLDKGNAGNITVGRRTNGSDGEEQKDMAGEPIFIHRFDSTYPAYDKVDVLQCSAALCGRYKAIILGCGNPVVNKTEVPKTPNRPEGFLDGKSCESIFGWAFNNEFDRFVHIYVDGPLRAGVVKDQDYFEVQATQNTRPDVAAARPGIPSTVGWSWDGGPLKNDGKAHKIWIYVTDRGSNFAVLAGGEAADVNFNCPKPVVNSCPAGPLSGKPAPDNDLRNCPESPIAICKKLTLLSPTVQINTEARFVATANALNGAKITAYKADYGDGTNKSYETSAQTYDLTHKYDKLGTYKIVLTVQSTEGDKTSGDCEGSIQVTPQPVPCPYDPALLLSDTAKCKPCPENPLLPESNTQLCSAKKIIAKKVANITKNISDANNTTASPGDILEYTLLTTNTATKLTVDHETSEPISDILDYAVVDNIGNAKLKDNVLSWPKVTIVAGDTLKQAFRVKVKDTIPATPPSITDNGTFDLKMVNTYGNSTLVNVPCPPTLCIQNTATKLPQTGPGSTMLITFVIVCFIGFFYNRNRILAKELNIIKLEYTSGA